MKKEESRLQSQLKDFNSKLVLASTQWELAEKEHSQVLGLYEGLDRQQKEECNSVSCTAINEAFYFASTLPPQARLKITLKERR